MIQRHHAAIREILGHFSEGEEIETAGDSFFIVFTKPSDAVKFSLLVQRNVILPCAKNSSFWIARSRSSMFYPRI